MTKLIKVKMKLSKILILALVVVFIGFCLFWFSYLKKAHKTFDNYYAFRGCQSLIEKTDTFGICKLKDGKTIKIVLYQGKWFLDGDLPGGFLSW